MQTKIINETLIFVDGKHPSTFTCHPNDKKQWNNLTTQVALWYIIFANTQN